MKITVINGSEKHGVTYRLKEEFLSTFRDKAEITEFYLPKDCPNFCCGCTRCFREDESKCKDREYIAPIEKAILEADLLVFTSTVYVYHATGAMKNLLDHFGYRWMPHRPAGEMFGKRAVIISQCLGGGVSSTVKDIKDSLSWWGITWIKPLKFRLMSDIDWDKIPEKRRASILRSVDRLAAKCASLDYGRPARAGLLAKGKFMIVRSMQKGLGKDNPEYEGYKYWNELGWIGKARPWK